ncbi:NAP1-related protein 1 [Hibiscus syriacus]|uniref:NAP1-related protein 1 n=1 Tax=Hibiscus syriacus TaxID=106335 RepID=A0A6A2Z1A8_HIBSY|nr:NAP1-related protein 1 [Hibiscus syriacus]
MNSMISVSSITSPSLPLSHPHNDPTLLFSNIRFSLKSVSMLRRRISIDLFFYVQFLSHPALGEPLNDEDQKNFDPNPYFEDAKLTKTFTFLDEGTKITATKIKWKEGMGLPNGVDHEKKGNKRQFAEERFAIIFVNQISPQPEDFSHIKPEINLSVV